MALLLGLLAPWASAAQLNAIVSRYSAAEFAGAVAQFQQHNPHWQISARTPEQLAELDEPALRAWLGEGRALLGVGLFGAEVERLGPMLGQVAPADSFLMHSEHALVQLSRSRGRPLFASREAVETLGRLRPQGELAGWIARRQAEHPRQAEWIAARSYWQAGGIDNIAALLAWLAARHDPDVKVPAVQARPSLRFHQQGALRAEAELQFAGDGLVALIDHGRADRAGDRELNDALCQRLESSGLACASLFADWGPGSLEAVRWLKEDATRRSPPSSCCRTSWSAAAKAARRSPGCSSS
ncbi:hypothetical protein ACFSHR_02245 [Azotobacter chroococcum]